jgi:hypothetical protein
VKPLLQVSGHNGNQSLAENVYRPEDPNFKHLLEIEPVCKGINFGPLRFFCRQVFVYLDILLQNLRTTTK